MRALVRKAGFNKCATFATRKSAVEWAAKIERELDDIGSTGVIRAPGKTLGDLIDRYVLDLHPIKPDGSGRCGSVYRTDGLDAHGRANS